MSTSEKPRKKPAIDAPFAPTVLRRARAAAGKYAVILWQENGRYVGSSVELPDCLGVGRTPAECERQTRAVMVSALAADMERGLAPPSPASANRRTEQINIRLSPVERRRLEVAAEAGGYHGLSDYIRDKVLAKG
jgi:predicted RNase H-like HicB family nuclease